MEYDKKPAMTRDTETETERLRPYLSDVRDRTKDRRHDIHLSMFVC